MTDKSQDDAEFCAAGPDEQPCFDYYEVMGIAGPDAQPINYEPDAPIATPYISPDAAPEPTPIKLYTQAGGAMIETFTPGSTLEHRVPAGDWVKRDDYKRELAQAESALAEAKQRLAAVETLLNKEVFPYWDQWKVGLPITYFGDAMRRLREALAAKEGKS